MAATSAGQPGLPNPPAGARMGPIVCDASEWGVLDIAGEDAAAFLQGQLSSDVTKLAPGTGQWTSYNSPRGRMLANGFLWRSAAGEHYRLALGADLAEPIHKRLSMFVLRSKVTVVDLTPTYARIGVIDADAMGVVAAAFGEAPAPGRAIQRDRAEFVALPDGRILIVAPMEDADAVRARLAYAKPPAHPDAWRRYGIRAGVAVITLATQDSLLPQAANVDLLGGVILNREKGCFPGQEIIKRAQARGQLKERLYAFHVAGPVPSPGAKLFGSTFGSQSCGVVVNAASSPEGGSDILATVQFLAAKTDALYLDSPDGPALSPMQLPYSIPYPDAPPARPA